MQAFGKQFERLRGSRSVEKILCFGNQNVREKEFTFVIALFRMDQLFCTAYGIVQIQQRRVLLFQSKQSLSLQKHASCVQILQISGEDLIANDFLDFTNCRLDVIIGLSWKPLFDVHVRHINACTDLFGNISFCRCSLEPSLESVKAIQEAPFLRDRRFVLC